MLLRVMEPGRPAFQLRKGEEGVSIFDTDAIVPPLDEAEVLAGFRAGSAIVTLSATGIEAKGLRVIPVPGADPLPPRLRAAHAEIRPGLEMSRRQFKQALQELE